MRGESGDGKAGAPGRNRTADTRFRKPMLYPLSYEGTTSINCSNFKAERYKNLLKYICYINFERYRRNTMTIKVRHKNKHVKCGKHFSGLSKPNSSGTVSSLRLQSAHKKLLTSIIAIIIAFAAGTIFYKAVNAYADETTTINGITYTISSYYKTASVTGYDLTDGSGFPEDGNVTILSSVTYDDTECFEMCF